MMTKTALAATLIFLVLAGLAQASTRCALLNAQRELIEFRVIAGDECPPDLPAKGLEWVPAPEVTAPSFNSATQVLTGPTVTIGADEVTTSYSVRDKTAQELAADADAGKEARLESIDAFVLKTLCDHESRIRVLEGKSAVTLAQCRAAIKAALSD
jgi:hypothetical protein